MFLLAIHTLGLGWLGQFQRFVFLMLRFPFSIARLTFFIGLKSVAFETVLLFVWIIGNGGKISTQ